MWGLLRDAGVIIIRDRIYCGNRMIERKEPIRVEGKNTNNIRIYLD